MLMNLDFLHNKLYLEKPLIIQKYCCHKMPNQFLNFFFVLHEAQQSDGSVHFYFGIFLKNSKGN
jgi:hypothetical protein